jgi:hypothetical protein
MFHVRTKHIEAKHHFIREQIQSENVDLVHIPSKDQVTNILIKAIRRFKFQGLRIKLGIVSISYLKNKIKIDRK